ncbi:MAG: hypothetical protein K5654_05250 [Lachnospiraceae bacterium]|nr:hypothetical protein [Lachnospiraceae bacterium]
MTSINIYSNIIGIDKLYNIDHEFDWNKISGLFSIKYDIIFNNFFEQSSQVVLGLIYSLSITQSYELKVIFSDVCNFRLNNIGNQLIQISGFEIQDKIKDGWLNPRFLVNDYEGDIFSFLCNSIEISSVEKSTLF